MYNVCYSVGSGTLLLPTYLLMNIPYIKSSIKFYASHLWRLGLVIGVPALGLVIINTI